MGQTRVNNQDIADGQVFSSDLADDCVTASKLGIIGTKGDMIVYGSQPEVLVTGVSGRVLVSDPTTSQGVAWTSTPSLSAIVSSTNNNIVTFINAGSSAVNFLRIANANTAGNPTIQAFGGDTDVYLRLLAKGAGKVVIGAYSIEVADISSAQTFSSKTLTSTTIGATSTSSISSTGMIFPKVITWVLASGTDATTGTDKTNTIVAPFDGTIVKWQIVAKTGPSGADLICDININAGTIFAGSGDQPTITDGGTSGSGNTFSNSSFLAGDLFTVDIDQVGSSVAGQDITLQLTVLLRNA